jgi:AraC-like ligand binding domain
MWQILTVITKTRDGQRRRDTGRVSGDWSRYWRAADEPLEAMHAHFREHVYHRHSHDTYSFGVTESGAQSFTCRGAAHTSAAGMVMAFNPDDPHDGRPTTSQGFSYRMIHVGPGLVAEVLADIRGRPSGRPGRPLGRAHQPAGISLTMVTPLRDGGDEQPPGLARTGAALMLPGRQRCGTHAACGAGTTNSWDGRGYRR